MTRGGVGTAAFSLSVLATCCLCGCSSEPLPEVPPPDASVGEMEDASGSDNETSPARDARPDASVPTDSGFGDASATDLDAEPVDSGPVVTCGDGILTPNELCDDGNTHNLDGCSKNCEIEEGFWCTPGDRSICDGICGDGLVKGNETCDDGNYDNFDGCSGNCWVETGWGCGGSPTTCVAYCGDGLIRGAETCDDGADFDQDALGPGDGCGYDCQLEPGWWCAGTPSVCQTVCGDGVVMESEVCDDGGLEVGDGCDANCRLEVGFRCSGEPSVCAPVGETLAVAKDLYSCGILANGSMTCWGEGLAPAQPAPLIPPSGSFADVTAGEQFFCGLHDGGDLECWAPAGYGIAAPPQGTFVSVTTGLTHACALTQTGTVTCWGSNSLGEASPPSDVFTSISAGDAHTCGLRPDGTVSCWGDDQLGQSSQPEYIEGPFGAVSAGAGYTCALRPNGYTECWGVGGLSSSDPFSALYASKSGYTCGVHAVDKTVECSGGPLTARTSEPFLSVSASQDYLCGLRPDRTVVCFENGNTLRLRPPTPVFTHLTAAGNLSCGVRAQDGEIMCWGNATGGRALAPPGPFDTIDLSEIQACGVRLDHSLGCWSNGVQLSTPGGTFSQVSVGWQHTCALRTDGTPICWGYDSWGETLPPAGTFTSVQAGKYWSCGIHTDQTVECWPPPGPFEDPDPQGAFTSLVTGHQVSCALRATDGSVECWGFGTHDASWIPPPSGSFTSLSQYYGVFNSAVCGLRPSGSVECWGFVLSSPLPEHPHPGPFTFIATGVEHMCGLLSDGHADCWYMRQTFDDGQTDVPSVWFLAP